MELTINGERKTVEDGATILSLLETLELEKDATVVERNGEIVDRTAYGETALTDGDTLELVRFVGGG